MYRIGDLVSVVNRGIPIGPTPRRLGFVTHVHKSRANDWRNGITVTYLEPYTSWDGSFITQHLFYIDDTAIKLVSRSEDKNTGETSCLK